MRKFLLRALKFALVLLVAIAIFIAGEWSADTARYKHQRISAELDTAWDNSDELTWAVDPFLSSQAAWHGPDGESRCYSWADDVTDMATVGKLHIPRSNFEPLLSKPSRVDEGWIVFFLTEDNEGERKSIFSCWLEKNGTAQTGKFVKPPFDFPVSISKSGTERQFSAMLDQLERIFPPLDPKSGNFTESLAKDVERTMAAYEQRGLVPQLALKLAVKERLGIDIYVPAE